MKKKNNGPNITASYSESSFLKREDPLDCFGDQPADMTKEEFELARVTAEKIGSRLPSQVEQSAFYFYYMGASWEEIANKLNIPLGILLYTGIFYKWQERKKLVTSVRAGEKVTRADAAAIDLVTDAIVATAALYKQQLAEVIKDPTQAKNCPLIPKNYRDFMTLLDMLQSLQTKEAESKSASGTVVNVNVANLTNNAKNKTETIESSVIEPVLLEEKPEQDRLELLELLEKVKTR